jgi:ABC-type uncharacterized transport system substrate-binding protein
MSSFLEDGSRAQARFHQAYELVRSLMATCRACSTDGSNTAHRRTDGARGERPGISRLLGRVPGGTPETRVDGRPQHPNRRWGALDDAEARQRSAKELVELQPEIILTQNTPPTASMLQQTRTIPVVFAVVADPVGSGFVQNLARPGGNATGFTIMEPTTMGKWLELLKEVAPRTNRAALLFNPATTPYANIYLDPFKAAAASLGLESSAATVRDRAKFDTVIAAQARESNGGLIVMPDGFLNVHRAEIILLAARYHLPAVYPWRFFAEQGGLLSYGSEQGDLFRQAATYVDRILKGEKPADLPV